MQRYSNLQIGMAVGAAICFAGTAAYLLYKRSEKSQAVG